MAPPQKVLIVAPNWLGDAVLSLPAARALRNLWPEAHLAVLCKENLTGWLAAQPTFDEVRSYPPPGRGLRANISFARSFGRDGFDLAVLFPNSLRSALFAWVGGIPRRVGYARDARGPLLTQRVRRYQGPKRHHAEYYLDIARQLGWQDPAGTSRERLTEFEPAAVGGNDQAWIDEQLASAGVSSGETLVGLTPGAAFGPAKRWSPERFAEVCMRLLERWPLRLILFGGPDDVAAIERLSAKLGPAFQDRLVNLAGSTSVGQLAAGLKRCGILMTNDSGAMHLAAAVGVPTVAIFGSTDPQWTGPLGDGHQVLAADVPCRPCFQRTCAIGYQCMESITSNQVFERAAAILTQRASELSAGPSSASNPASPQSGAPSLRSLS